MLYVKKCLQRIPLKVLKLRPGRKQQLYFENLDRTKIQALKDNLNRITEVDKNGINSIMQEIESIFENAKNITFTKRKSSLDNKESKSKHKFGLAMLVS